MDTLIDKLSFTIDMLQNKACINFINLIQTILNEDIAMKVFDLNHDLVFENLIEVHNLGNQYHDGFTQNENIRLQDNQIIEGKRYTQFPLSKKLHHYKPHGSLNIYQIGGQKVYKINEPSAKFFADSHKAYKENSTIVQPTILCSPLNKPIILTNDYEYFPYIYSQLIKESVADSDLMIIGYGFGDHHINFSLNNFYKLQNLDKQADIKFLLKTENQKIINLFNQLYLKQEEGYLYSNINFEALISN